MLLMCGMAMQAASYTYTVPKHEFRAYFFVHSVLPIRKCLCVVKYRKRNSPY